MHRIAQWRTKYILVVTPVVVLPKCHGHDFAYLMEERPYEAGTYIMKHYNAKPSAH